MLSYVISGLAAVLLAYLLAVMPRTLGRPDMHGICGVKYYAHRGLHSKGSAVPENTLPAFQKAVEHGYGIELDIRLTKDRIPVVFHDATLRRACGLLRPVSSYTLRELQEFPLFHSKERIPSLQEVLGLVDGKVPLLIEFKAEGIKVPLCPIAAKVLAGYRGEYCIQSFHPGVLWWYRTHCPRVVRGQLVTCYEAKAGAGKMLIVMQRLLLNFLTKPDFIAANCACPGLLSVRLCRALYRTPIFAWTVRDSSFPEKAKNSYQGFIFEGFCPPAQAGVLKQNQTDAL